MIVGNPPFLGGKQDSRGTGDEYVDDLWNLYEGRVPAGADLVCYWFEKARAQIEDGTSETRRSSGDQLYPGRGQPSCAGAHQADGRHLLRGVGSALGSGRRGGPRFDGRIRRRNGDGDGYSTAHRSRDHADLTGDLDLTAAERLPENTNICFHGRRRKAARST